MTIVATKNEENTIFDIPSFYTFEEIVIRLESYGYTNIREI